MVLFIFWCCLLNNLSEQNNNNANVFYCIFPFIVKKTVALLNRKSNCLSGPWKWKTYQSSLRFVDRKIPEARRDTEATLTHTSLYCHGNIRKFFPIINIPFLSQEKLLHLSLKCWQIWITEWMIWLISRVHVWVSVLMNVDVSRA